jgi:hypothetical protein
MHTASWRPVVCRKHCSRSAFESPPRQNAVIAPHLVISQVSFRSESRRFIAPLSVIVHGSRWEHGTLPSGFTRFGGSSRKLRGLVYRCVTAMRVASASAAVDRCTCVDRLQPCGLATAPVTMAVVCSKDNVTPFAWDS